MYQMSFLAAASSSTVLLDAALELAEPLLARHQVGRAGLEHRPALALESFGQQPQERRSCRRRCSPLTSSERAGVCSDAASAATSASCHASGSIRSSASFRSAQNRPNEARNVRSTLARWTLSSCRMSAVACA